MNKGMIMEVKKSYAIALNDKGIMDKITFKKNMEVGQKIFYFEDDIVKATENKVRRHNSFIKAFGSIAALFLLVFTFFNAMKYEQAYAVVSLDINPSIQMEVDSNKKVLKIEGVNNDGKSMDFTDIKGLDIDEGIQKIKEKLVEKKYLDTNNEVLVAVAFKNNNDNSSYEETLKNAIRTTFNNQDITYIKADEKEVEEAKKQSISLGRYKAQESISVDQETKTNISKAPVKEITALIKDKENVIQWDAKDDKAIDVPAVDTKPEVKSDNGATSTDPDKNVNRDKPIVNIPSENGNSNIDKDTGNGTIAKPITNDVLEVEPEAPPVKEQEKNTKPAGSTSIDIVPSDGTIENKPTSGKIESETKINEAAKVTVEPTTSAVNKETKN